MEYTKNSYETKKISFLVKKKPTLFIYNAIKNKQNNVKKIEHILKPQKLLTYKLLNNAAKTVFLKSIFKNYSHLISSLTLIVALKTEKIDYLTEKELTRKILKNTFAFVAVKIDNKIYNHNHVNRMSSLFYKKTFLKFFKILLKCSKSTASLNQIKLLKIKVM